MALSPNASFQEIINAINSLPVNPRPGATGNAQPSQVLTGATFSNIDEIDLVGTMPDRGTVNITPSSSAQTIPQGYHNGLGKVSAVSVPAANVLTGTTIAGVAGTMPNIGAISQSLAINGSYTVPAGYHNGAGKITQSIPTKGVATITPGKTSQTIASGQYLTGTQTIASLGGNAVAGNVLAGKSFSSDSAGRAVAGAMTNRGAVTNTITTQGGSYTIPAGYHSGAGKVTASFANLVAGNIKAGVDVGGVVGTFDGGTIYPNRYDQTWAWNEYGVNSYPIFNITKRELFIKATIKGATQAGGADNYTFTVTVTRGTVRYALYRPENPTPVKGSYSVTVDLKPTVLLPGDKINVYTSGDSFSPAPNRSTGYAFTTADFPESLEPYIDVTPNDVY